MAEPPTVSGAKLAKTGENLLPDGNQYAELVGSLLYLSTTTRPDIAFAVGVVSLYMACPEKDHMRAANGGASVPSRGLGPRGRVRHLQASPRVRRRRLGGRR